MVMAATITAVTAVTMPTEWSLFVKPCRRLTILGTAITAILFGLTLLYLSAPRIAAYSRIAPLTEIRTALKTGEPLDAATLNAAYAQIEIASSWLPSDPDILLDQGMIARRLSETPELSKGERDSYLLIARQVFRRALRAGPNRSFAWALWADVELASGRSPGEIADALALSKQLGPKLASSMFVRVRLALDHWDALPERVHTNTYDDLRGFWSAYPLRPRLVSMYLQQDFRRRTLIRDAALITPDDVAQFNKLLLRTVKKTR